ncbi:MAG: GAF domain-containing protein, partial [Anaerolineae bacterium]|nr:GAF domain-containing protein [Anaerolineae bacterium]
MVTNTLTILQRENARLQADHQALHSELAQLRDFVEILKGLTAANEAVTSDEALRTLLHRTFQQSMDLLNAPDGSLLLLDEETHELQFVLVKGMLAENLLNYRISADEGIAGWVMQNASAALVRDVRHDPRFSHTIDEEFKFRTQSIAAVPLTGSGKVFGVLEIVDDGIGFLRAEHYLPGPNDIYVSQTQI